LPPTPVCLLASDSSDRRAAGALMRRESDTTLAAPLLSVDHLVVEYSAQGQTVHAVTDVSLAIARGETMGLVGESGCAKPTLARAILCLPSPKAGQIRFDGTELTALRGAELRAKRRRLQIIFQDPIASLNPRRRIADILAEPLLIA